MAAKFLFGLYTCRFFFLRVFAKTQIRWELTPTCGNVTANIGPVDSFSHCFFGLFPFRFFLFRSASRHSHTDMPFTQNRMQNDGQSVKGLANIFTKNFQFIFVLGLNQSHPKKKDLSIHINRYAIYFQKWLYNSW